MKKTLSAGTYYIGDISDVINEQNQHLIFYQQLNPSYTQLYDNNDKIYFLITSKFGIAPTHLFEVERQQLQQFGAVYIFRQKFNCTYKNGIFKFGKLVTVDIDHCGQLDEQDVQQQQVESESTIESLYI